MPDITMADTMADMPTTGFQTSSAHSTAGAVRAQLQPGQAIVVRETADGRVVGVIAPGEVARLEDAQRTLAEHRELWQAPTFVVPTTPIADVLVAMRYDKSIRWQVVVSGQEVVGVVSPDALFDLLNNVQALEPDAKLAKEVFGDPIAEPSGLCYLCSAEPVHYIAPERVEDRTVDGQALCPQDGSLMNGTFVCPKE
jgi:CBS domain containing-hemolysin-like protein